MASHASVAAYRAPPKKRCWLLLALVAPAAGCSADVTRFDFPAFGIADNGGSPTGALPTPSSPVASSPAPSTPAWQRPPTSSPGSTPSYNSGTPSYTPNSGPSYTLSSGPSYTNSSPSDTPSYTSPSREVLARPPRGAGLDAPGAYGRGADPPPDAHQVGQVGQGVPASRDAGGHPPERRGERPRIAASGETIEVQPGDTLHGIARRHGVPIGALIEVNGLGDGAALKPGQRLLLPVGASPRASAPERASNPPAGWEDHHTLQVGESLYAVARQYRVELGELQRVNGIADPTKVRAGTPLIVPRGEVQPASPPAEAGQRAPPLQVPSTNQPEAVKTADLGNRADDAGTALDKFRWPARGRVIAPFGTRPDGTHNDGINIAVPLGTEIHAAEAGRVAYAGNELKGYGNLVLIRHDGGWVSAYAHADQILVKRDEVVRRGQVIAHAGKTGSVDQPQLHFELRHGAKPVDPLPQLER
jgi:murein DD-endopeptidase MepM/ murein hydrolase activator NlpD